MKYNDYSKAPVLISKAGLDEKKKGSTRKNRAHTEIQYLFMSTSCASVLHIVMSMNYLIQMGKGLVSSIKGQIREIMHMELVL